MSDKKRIYEGANWIKKRSYGENISPLGETVADILGDAWMGIYHLSSNSNLHKVDWSDEFCIDVPIGYESLATVDSNHLLRLVVLSYHHAVRLEISGHTHKWLKLRFQQRKRDGGWWEKCPPLLEAVAAIEKHYGIGEVES